jgi:adenosine kinase
MARIIVSGSVAYDRIMDYDGLFADHIIAEKVRSINLSFVVERLTVEHGGTAGNIAYNLALLGEKPEIIATVGQDFGEYRSHMLLSGIDPTPVRMVEGDMTSVAFVFTDKADNQIAAFHPGAGALSYDSHVEVDGRSFAFVAPGNVDDMRALPQHYRQYGLRYYYDPGQQITALSPEDLLGGIHGAAGIFASDYEFTLIMEKTKMTEVNLLDHVPMIVVTNGADGSEIITTEGRVRVPAVPVADAVDPTGAGDAFRAGFLKGLLLGVPAVSCARLGSVVAAYNVEQYGTQKHKFTLADIAGRYNATYEENIPLV